MKKPKRRWIRLGIDLIIISAVVFFSKSYFVGMFFHPDTEEFGDASYHRLEFEDVYFPSRNGNKLHAYFFKPDSSPKGTIIQCHGNAGNLTHHYTGIIFLVKAGYNVLTFDYSGYGRSTGKPSPKGIIQDTLGAIDYVRSRKDVDRTRIGLLGQSLGGAAAAGAMAQEKEIACAVLEATFTTYRAMAWETFVGKFLFFLTPFVIPNVGPIKELKKIAPRPLMFIHGTDDTLIPAKFSKQLYEKAEGKKALALIKERRHLYSVGEDPEYEKAIIEFFDKNINPAKQPASL